MKSNFILPTLTGLVLTNPLTAGIILQNNFDAETVGLFPAAGFADFNAQGIRVVEDDASGTPFGASNQYFHLGGANLRVATAVPGSTLSGLLKVSFDLFEPTGVGSTALLFGFASGTPLSDLNANTAYGFSLSNGNFTTGTNTSVESGTLPTLSEGQAYRMQYTLNLTGATASYPDPTNPANPALSLDDGRLALWVQDLGSGTWSGPVVLTTTQANAPVEFLFRGFSTNNNEIYIDNFAVSDAGMWDGEGTDGLWSTTTNWDGDTIPTAGSALTFGASPDSFLTNDLTPETLFSGLSFLPSAADYLINGASITLTGAISSDSPSSQVIGLPIVLGADLEVQANNADVILDGAISGNFGLEKTGPGTALLTNVNTYTGDTVVSEGTLQLGDGSFTGELAGNIVNNATLNLQPSVDLDFANAVSGSGNLRVSGPGIVRLTGTNTYEGETQIEDGFLLLDGGSDIPVDSAVAFVGAGGQLDGDSKNLSFSALRSNGNGSGINSVVGSGSLTVTGGDLLVGPGSQPGNSVALDLSELPSFSYDNIVGIVSVGNQINNGSNQSGILSLSDLSVITADRIRVQNIISGTAGASSGLLELGADTTLNTDEIEIGHSGRDSGSIAFRSGLATGSLTLRAADGTGRAAIDIGRRGSSFYPTQDVGIDLVSGGTVTSTLDALVSSLVIGDFGFGNGVSQNASFRMGNGNLDATSIKFGKMANGGTTGTLNSSFSLNGGSVSTPVVNFGDNTSVEGNLSATFEINSGSLAATTLQAGTTTSTGVSIRKLVLGGGSLSNLASTDLSVTDITVVVPAGSTPAIDVESGKTATLSSGSTTEFVIDSSIGSSGTLTVTGDLILGSGAELAITDASAEPLPVGTTLTLLDYTAGTLTGAFEDTSGAPINDSDLITVGSNVFMIDYNNTLGGSSMAVTLTVEASFNSVSYVYDVGDRLGTSPLSTDNWTGDDLANWIGAGFTGDNYARNNNGGNDRITRANDAGFSYDIPASSSIVSLDITARTNSNNWQATLTTSGVDTLGVGYEGATDKFFLLDGATRIDEAGTTFTTGDSLVTVRVVIDLDAGTADLIYDPAGVATVIIDNAAVTVTGATLAASDGLGTRTNSQFNGVARYTIAAIYAAGESSVYNDWAGGFELDPETNGAPGEDPDNDGQNNLEEFATNDNPGSGSASGKVVGLVQDVDGDQVLTFTLPVRGSGTSFSGATQQVSEPVDGIVYRIQGSDDLSDWLSMVISEVTPALDAGLPALDSGWEYRTFRTPGTIDADPIDFIRVIIETAP